MEHSDHIIIHAVYLTVDKATATRQLYWMPGQHCTVGATFVLNVYNPHMFLPLMMNSRCKFVMVVLMLSLIHI